jgi:hypothetical protein
MIGDLSDFFANFCINSFLAHCGTQSFFCHDAPRQKKMAHLLHYSTAQCVISPFLSTSDTCDTRDACDTCDTSDSCDTSDACDTCDSSDSCDTSYTILVTLVTVVTVVTVVTLETLVTLVTVVTIVTILTLVTLVTLLTLVTLVTLVTRVTLVTLVTLITLKKWTRKMTQCTVHCKFPFTKGFGTSFIAAMLWVLVIYIQVSINFYQESVYSSLSNFQKQFLLVLRTYAVSRQMIQRWYFLQNSAIEFSLL